MLDHLELAWTVVRNLVSNSLAGGQSGSGGVCKCNRSGCSRRAGTFGSVIGVDLASMVVVDIVSHHLLNLLMNVVEVMVPRQEAVIDYDPDSSYVSTDNWHLCCY